MVLLQEVDEGVPRSREMDLARELAAWPGYPDSAVGHNVTLRKGRYGNATLSRHPIVRERNIDLTIGAPEAPRLPAHRPSSSSGAGGPRQRVEVFNLHLGLSARERAQQIGAARLVAEFMHPAAQRAPASWPATSTIGARCCEAPSRAARSAAPATAASGEARAIRTFPSLVSRKGPWIVSTTAVPCA